MTNLSQWARWSASCFFLLSSLLVTVAQNNGSAALETHIRRATTPIKLDGLLDEAAWQSAEMATDFRNQFPVDTGISHFRTEVRLTFDEQHLYVGAVCYERRQDYTVQSLRRDFPPGSSDALNIILDPFKDGQNGFLFSLNPLNVQREALISTGNTLSYEWDNKWASRVTNYDDRWVVEMAIPFKTLRYNVNEGENSWRVNYIRTVVKNFQVSTWAPVPFVFAPNNLAFVVPLHWDTPPPKPGANVSIIPYVIGSQSIDYVRDPKTLEQTDRLHNWTGNIGGDAKIALSPGLNLDLTVNPDFSQVEVDRQVANLSRFELFFPERRQFFLENRDLFAMFGFPSTRPFFSRRVGLAYNPVKEQNEKVPILAGARLSGKLNDNWRIGLLTMQTQRMNWSADTLLPAANFTVATAQRKVLKRSTLSAILVNKQNFLENLNEVQRKGWQPWNRVAGLEYNLNSNDNRWEGEWYYHRSFSPDKTQRGSTLASFLGYSDRYVNGRLGYNRVDSTYRAEAGFVPRPGVQSFFPGIGFQIYPKKGWAAQHVTNYNVGVEGDLTYGLDWKRTDQDLIAFAGINFKDQSFLRIGSSQTYIYLFEPFDPSNTGQPKLSVGGYTNYRYRILYQTGTTRNLQGFCGFNAGEFFNGTIATLDGELTYRKQPLGLISMQLTYNQIRLPKPYASTDFWLVGPRMELAFSRSLFASAFFQYNTQVNNFNINARLQWRFAPVSDVFLVYTDNSYAQPVANTRAGLFSPKNKAVVLKVVYWLNV